MFIWNKFTLIGNQDQIIIDIIKGEIFTIKFILILIFFDNQ